MRLGLHAVLFIGRTKVNLATVDYLDTRTLSRDLSLDVGVGVAMLRHSDSRHHEFLGTTNMRRGQPVAVPIAQRRMVVKRNDAHGLSVPAALTPQNDRRFVAATELGAVGRLAM